MDISLSTEEKIKTILVQTDYSYEKAKEHLELHNDDEYAVIKSYMGITDKKADPSITSLNQEIYKQIRFKLANKK